MNWAWRHGTLVRHKQEDQEPRHSGDEMEMFWLCRMPATQLVCPDLHGFRVNQTGVMGSGGPCILAEKHPAVAWKVDGFILHS